MKRRNAKRPAARLLCVLLAAGALLGGCVRENQPVRAQSDEKPDSVVSGYYSPGQSLHGGSGVSRLNLRDIEISQSGEDWLIVLTFMTGSAKMGMEEKPASGVPLYATRFLPGVDRLMLEIEGLAFWDYRVYDSEIRYTPIQGIFKQIPVNSETTCLYFNIMDSFAYRIQSVNHQLFIYLRPLSEEESVSWYVTVDGFNEYTNGELPGDFAMAPSLCDDLANVTLLSAPFGAEEDARAFIADHQDTLDGVLPGKKPAVVQLRSNQLPAFDESAQISALTNTPVGRVGGEKKTFPGFIENGRFLCWHPDGAAYAFIKPYFLSSSQEDEVYYNEQIWVGDTLEGTSLPLVEYDFSSITRAQYSADGRYLAFLEQTGSARMLEIIDTQTGQVSIAAEDDFGEDTSDFVWDTAMPRLYAITGGVEGMQMMCYDLTGGTDGALVYALEEEAFTEGDIGRGGDCVYFTQSGAGAAGGSVVSLNINTGERTVLTTGYGLSMIPDGEWIAVSDVVRDETGKESYCLKVIRVDGTGETVVDAQDVIVDFVWSPEGTRLYYTIYRDTTALGEEYPLSLYRYDVETGRCVYVMDMATGALYPGGDAGSVLMMYIYNQRGRSIPVTYRIPAAP